MQLLPHIVDDGDLLGEEVTCWMCVCNVCCSEDEWEMEWAASRGFFDFNDGWD